MNEAYRAAGDSGPLAGRLEYSEEPLVSSDIVGDPSSCVFDSKLTMVAGQSGEGAGLVRQRVGLLQPARRPHPHLRREARLSPIAGRLPQLEDLPPVEGKKVLLRADFNVPLKDGLITDDLRIRAALPTIQWLVDHGAEVTACTHLGRPKGKPDPKYSVEPVRRRLGELAPGCSCWRT